MALTLDEIDRYGRQVLAPGWGGEGQERVRAATVRVRGAGQAAEAAALYLAGAGVGRLEVEAHAEAARALNPLVEVAPLAARESGGAVAVSVENGPTIRGDGDRAAVGAACALEALKSLLGLPFRGEVRL